MLLMKYTVIACLIHWLGLCTAYLHDRHPHHLLRRQFSSPAYTGPMVPSYNISMPVDHFNDSDDRTYNNRYWVNDTFYQPGGPVFYYDFGEIGVTDQMAAHYLAEVNTTSAVMILAEEYHGMVVALELRYYGYSWPVTKNWTTSAPAEGQAGYEYHTTEQGLEDLVYFANNWQPQGCSGDECQTLRPSNTPWIWLGGSYPGVRGAFMRIRNPEIFYAVWSSSAPVEAMYDGSPYFSPVLASLPTNCSKDMRTAIMYADEIMAGEHGPAQYLELQRLTNAYAVFGLGLGLPSLYSIDDADSFDTYTIGQEMTIPIIANFQNQGPINSTDIMCSFYEVYNPGGTPSNGSDPYLAVLTNPGDGTISAQGLAETYNASVALEAYFFAAARYWKVWFNTTVEDSRDYQDWVAIDLYADQLSWRYTVNTEIGWYQGSNPDNVTIISQYYNYTAVQSQGNAMVYPDIPGGWEWPAEPNTTTFLQYGGWNMTPSHVMFTDGEFDPWRGGTVMSNMTFIDAPVRHMTEEIPACGQPPPGSDVFGVVYPGHSHVPDLAQRSSFPYNESSPVYVGVQLFSAALDTWLPCFNSTRRS